jgi:hypothetical protein
VLRLLLVFLSRQIYVPPSQLFIKPCIYTLHLVQKRSRRDTLTLLCSLLNTAMKAGHPLGNTIGGMAGKIPYNHLVFKGEDPRATLVGISFQVLCVLLDFQSGSARDIVSGSGDAQSSAPTAQTNAFRYFLMKLVSLNYPPTAVPFADPKTIASNPGFRFHRRRNYWNSPATNGSDV